MTYRKKILGTFKNCSLNPISLTPPPEFGKISELALPGNTYYLFLI
jgi:hypothetical protein